MPDVFDFLPGNYLLPVCYRFFTARSLATLEYRYVRPSATYQTQQQLVAPFYKHISRCVPPFSL